MKLDRQRGGEDLEASGNLFPVERSQEMAVSVLPMQQANNSCFTDMITLNRHDLFMVVVGGTINIFQMVK